MEVIWSIPNLPLPSVEDRLSFSVLLLVKYAHFAHQTILLFIDVNFIVGRCVGVETIDADSLVKIVT